MDVVRILLLGRFEISVNDGGICHFIARTRKGCALLQYLLLHRGRAIKYDDLFEALWPNENSTDPESALKTLVSRTRALLEKCSAGMAQCITSARGSYQWNDSFPCQVDLFEFERLCADLKNKDELTEQSRELYTKTLRLYRGDLLSDSTQEVWMTARGASLHDSYVHIAHRYLEMLKAVADYDEIIRVCRTALEVDAFDEMLNISLMDALVKSKRSNEALNQYKLATDLHIRYLGMQLPEGIQDFYRQIVKAGQALEMDINSLRTELKEYGESRGAFVCEYAVFKDIYNLLLRRTERTSNTIFLALFMISRSDGAPMEASVLNELMDHLLDVIKKSLRKGDIITQYNASQYAMMLPLQTYDNGRMVMERIKKMFYEDCAPPDVVCGYRVDLISDKGNDSTPLSGR
jgi:DNA-binding SARP family transcriptional activator